MKLKRPNISWIALLFVLSAVLISGTAFILMVFFGMYGLSRLLIYFHLAEFTYNESVMDNSFYYGSYLIIGYVLLFIIEYIMDELKRMLPENKFFHGWYFHIISVSISTIVFYFGVHINYQHIRINFFVVLAIISALYYLTELFYPDSVDLNNKENR
ncbi:SepA family multidrug efflux transporter [Macrococcoides caseolyticum subsp. caseolyticum]|uniref:SepA family multidrug efflux transporter n=1 Tax=Macrococcoides caseolyticum TaxID=69966 RepID=UPI000A294782|nr:SepA family multidrug efflux transporter [Macrococcus caseolyticus]ARQ03666.1 Multidrug resistance efflux pump SepA [Macrococcus caseolyticus]PKE05806.1 multidrug resistance protein SepA [Macrococcus caseolyticus]PKE22986.1 multidrug resistance protein SepA [Macrococcus caseolyticus]PKE52040.1 multidrug resistance protein SepA [Macrococcus caseolyticus]PKF37570.1 multidrug resistance protein SepA [Macrococcus caseolyticus]